MARSPARYPEGIKSNSPALTRCGYAGNASHKFIYPERVGSSVEHPMVLEPIQAYPKKMKININFLPSRPTSIRVARRLTSVIACFGTLAILAGCDTGPQSNMVSSPPPPAPTRSVTTTTTTTPDTMPGVAVGSPANVIVTTATPAGATIVTEAPPALQSEVVLAQPSPNYVWVPGYWTWSSQQQYQWTSGRWAMPPNPGAVWVAPRWEQQGNAYRFTEGYWN